MFHLSLPAMYGNWALPWLKRRCPLWASVLWPINVELETGGLILMLKWCDSVDYELPGLGSPSLREKVGEAS